MVGFAGGPAFPTVEFRDNGGFSISGGMTLRDYFAAKALEGMTASPELMKVITSLDIENSTAFEKMAQKSYEMADAMLAQREK